MTPEVKQRIEQIRQGIVPKGYKKTKTDIVPADWKESPIGEYIREYTEKTTIPNQYPVLTSARTGLMLQTDYYSNRQVTTEDNVGYNILPYGYITFRSRSDDGRFRFNENRIIERGVISYFYPVFSFSEEVCHEYMLYLLNFSIYRRMYPYAEGTAQQVLSLKKLGQLKYSLPLVAEQKKIAEILSTQDKTIELQGRKIEELKRFKKGCLEKMFPRKGQKVPEKRFPGFTDDWEQRKLGDIGKARSGVGFPDAEQGGVTGIPFFKVSDMNLDGNESEMTVANNYVTAEQIAVHRWSPITELPAIFFAKVGAAVMLNRKRLCRFPFLLDNNTMAYSLSSTKWDADFAKALFGTVDLTSLVQVGALPSYNAGDVESMEIYLPSLLEQEQIGGFFKQLDNLITLHQRKLEEMKKQKKALMQLLLTGIVRI
jgi:type I restriction enzyme S subunit